MKKAILLLSLATLALLYSCGGSDSSKEDQTILFDNLPQMLLGEAPFTLEASSSSGLPVTFTSNDPSIASVSGTTVTIHKEGNVWITAKQEGNDQYYEAPSIMRILTVLYSDPGKQNQTIDFQLDVDEWIISQGVLSLKNYASSSSGLPVTFTSSRPSAATIDNATGELSVVFGIDRQVITIFASQAGDNTYNPAPTVSQTLTVVCDQH